TATTSEYSFAMVQDGCIITAVFVAVGEPEPLEHVIINQVYGSGPLDNSGAVSHSFIELYNSTDSVVSLEGWSLQIQNGTASGVVPTEWEKLNFPAGSSIEPGGYYLIRLAEAAPSARLVITKSDVDWTDGRIMSNRAYSVALVNNTTLLTQVITGSEMAGVVDLVGALNTSPPDTPLNFEGAPVKDMSKQKSIRRINYQDTDNNLADFEVLDYRATGMSDAELLVKGPRYSSGLAFGEEEPDDPGEGALPNHLIINQAAGIGAPADGAIQYSFVEIYNPTNATISLNGWSLQYAERGAEWEMIELVGEIPARHSYLVRMNGGNVLPATRLFVPDADLDWDIVISNRSYKFALVNNTEAITVYNPTAANGVIDLVGADNPNDFADFWEGTGAVAKMSKQQSVRRIDFSDYDQNWYDFRSVDYRPNGTTADQLEEFRPRSLADGPWGLDIIPPGPPPVTAGEIEFMLPPGIYQEEIDLILISSDTNLVIRYTLDGSDPTFGSLAYADPLHIVDRTNEEMYLPSLTGTTGPRNEMPTYDRNAIEPTLRGTVVKAQLYNADGTPASGIYVGSYFVCEDIDSLFGDLPVVSMTTPADNLFNTTIGIYVKGVNGDDGPFNFDQKGSEWERAIFIEMFDPASGDDWEINAVISQGMGVRIHGGAARHFPQKSFRLYARTGTISTNAGVIPIISGSNTIDYDLFNGNSFDANGNPITGGYRRVLLRAAGNDAALSFIRDPITHVLSRNGTTNIENQTYRPVVLFINGEFWGIYHMEERFDEEYLVQHFGGNSSSYSVLENPSPGNTSPEDNAAADIEYFESVVAEINAIGNINTFEGLQAVSKRVDLDSLIDYVIIETLGGNLDWVSFDGEWDAGYAYFVYHGNNQRMWRYTGTPNEGVPGQDGRYRWMVYDTDKSWGYRTGYGEYNDPSYNTIEDALTDNLFFFNKLWQNDLFRAVFLSRYFDSLDSWLAFDVMESVVDDVASEIDPAIIQHQRRWPYSLGYEDWQSEIEYIKYWMALRVDPSGPFIQALRGYAANEVSIHAAAYTGRVDSLPDNVIWDISSIEMFMNASDFEVVHMTGVTVGTGFTVTATIEVIPEGLVYFIDAGTAELYTDGSPQYPATS
ncbi:MAG: CotH kinase family protein, partial [Coriobacteriia bacterium]|nr:CotH kinase family protein [Coriobacteriia bacterium]